MKAFAKKNWFSIVILVLLVGTWVRTAFQSGSDRRDIQQEAVAVAPAAAEPVVMVVEPTSTPAPLCSDLFEPYRTLPIHVVAFDEEYCYNDLWLWEWPNYPDSPIHVDGEFEYEVNRLLADTGASVVYRVQVFDRGSGSDNEYVSVQGATLLGVCPDHTWDGNLCHVISVIPGQSALVKYRFIEYNRDGTSSAIDKYVRIYQPAPTPTPVVPTPKPGPTIVYVERPHHYDGAVKCFLYDIFSGRGAFGNGYSINCP